MRGQSTTESTLQLTADVDGVIDDSVCSFLPRRDTNDVIICGFLGLHVSNHLVSRITLLLLLKANQAKNSIGPHFCTIDSPP